MIQTLIDFFSNVSKDTWQSVVISSFLIPFVFYIYTKFKTYLVSSLPLNLVLSGFRNSKKDILVFLSQLSGANNEMELIHNQLYITQFPDPFPKNQANKGIGLYQNIDTVWSQSDGLCAAEVFNLLGQINKHQGFRIADTLKDWCGYTCPTFSIGFNPKTKDLMRFCIPINFHLGANNDTISIEGHNTVLGSDFPEDAGILQKTYMKNSKVPVFILAGLGTTGTEASGKVLNENCISLGKLYGKSTFCVLFKTDITRGSEWYEIIGMFPKPPLYRAIWYPFTFIKWHLKKIYPLNQTINSST